ncbi:MAG TPA: hypothetical protein DC057_12455 [Spirochaetia bacterium]|nr:hypothetical protein [Spirochaetia bacterium]
MKKKIICTLIFILSSLLLKANTLTGYDTKVLFSSGIFEDPVNYIKYIPGVSAPFKYSTLFSMYGGKPGLNTYVFDSILIRKPYILNNLLSSINPLIIDSINLSVNSGVISLKSKKPSPKTGLTITHTIADTNSYINIALSHFSFLQIAARISHITAPLTFFKNELAQIGLSISPTPLYADLFLQFTYKKMFLTFTQSVIFRDESAENYHTGKHAYSDIYENSHLTYEGKNLFFHNQWNFDLTNNDSVNFRIGYEFYNNGYNYQLHETGTGYFSEDLRQKFKELTTLPLYIDSFYVDNLELKVNEVEKYHSIQSELKYNLKRDVSELNSGCGILVDYYNKSKDNIMYGHYIKDLTFTYGETVTVGVPIYQPEYIKNENDYGVINYYWFLNHAMIINDELSFKFGISIDGFLLKNFEKNLFSIPVIKPYFSINYLYSFNSMHIQSFLFSFESGISSDNFRDISYQTILEKFNNNYALPAEQYMYSNLTINITSPYIDIHTSAHAKVYTHNLYDIENNFTFDANGYFFNANIALSKQYSNKIYLYSGYSYSMNMRSKEVNNTFIYREVE